MQFRQWQPHYPHQHCSSNWYPSKTSDDHAPITQHPTKFPFRLATNTSETIITKINKPTNNVEALNSFSLRTAAIFHLFYFWADGANGIMALIGRRCISHAHGQKMRQLVKFLCPCAGVAAPNELGSQKNVDGVRKKCFAGIVCAAEDYKSSEWASPWNLHSCARPLFSPLAVGGATISVQRRPANYHFNGPSSARRAINNASRPVHVHSDSAKRHFVPGDCGCLSLETEIDG